MKRSQSEFRTARSGSSIGGVTNAKCHRFRMPPGGYLSIATGVTLCWLSNGYSHKHRMTGVGTWSFHLYQKRFPSRTAHQESYNSMVRLCDPLKLWLHEPRRVQTTSITAREDGKTD